MSAFSFSVSFLLLLAMSFSLTIFNSNDIISLIVWCGLIAYIATFYLKTYQKRVYLVDFACYKPNPRGICSKEKFIDRSICGGHFLDESINFQRKIMERSGFGDKTYVPESLLKIPPSICTLDARKETESVIFGAIDELLLKTKVKVEDIDILITNCCIFNPTPSLSAMVVNHYKLKQNVLSYNLGGMGCSAGLIAIDLAKQLLQVRSLF